MDIQKIDSLYETIIDKEDTYFPFCDLHNEDTSYRLVAHMLKDNYNVIFESEWPGYGLGCGYLKFMYDNIHYELNYDEMIGLWLETKDVTEDSPEELKHKVFNFCKEVYLATVEKEKEYE